MRECALHINKHSTFRQKYPNNQNPRVHSAVLYDEISIQRVDFPLSYTKENKKISVFSAHSV